MRTVRNASYRHDDEGSVITLCIKWVLLILLIAVGLLVTRRK